MGSELFIVHYIYIYIYTILQTVYNELWTIQSPFSRGFAELQWFDRAGIL